MANFGKCPTCGVRFRSVKRDDVWVPQCPKVDKHDYATYRNHSCRCEECTLANSAYQAERRAERRAMVAAGDPSVPHGKKSTHLNWGCSCRRCVKAHEKATKARARVGAKR